MGEDCETNPSFSKLKLPYLPLPAATANSPEHPSSGTATPPLHTLASVPFKWEEQPGKPRPCTDIIALPEPVTKSLELPPCRMLLIEPANKIPKMPSPTTVLDGPDIVGRPKFSSFRLFREAQLGSFDSSSSSCSPHHSTVDVLLGKKKRGFFGRNLRFRREKKEVDEGSLGFSPYSVIGCEVKMESFKMTRNGSSSSFSRAGSTHLWGTIYEGLKQAIPWKSARKSKKERLKLQEFNL